jgi:hypothetical protein
MDDVQVNEEEETSSPPMYQALVTLCRELVPRLEWEIDDDEAEEGHRMILVLLNNHQVTFRPVVSRHATHEGIDRACIGYALLSGDDYLLYDADEDEILTEALICPVFETEADAP